jgi:hypothetical protein
VIPNVATAGNRIMKIESESESRNPDGVRAGSPGGTPARALVVGDEEAMCALNQMGIQLERFPAAESGRLQENLLRLTAD